MTVDQMTKELIELSEAGHGKLQIRTERRREHGYLLIPSVISLRIVGELNDPTLCLSYGDELMLPFVELASYGEGEGDVE